MVTKEGNIRPKKYKCFYKYSVITGDSCKVIVPCSIEAFKVQTLKNKIKIIKKIKLIFPLSYDN